MSQELALLGGAKAVTIDKPERWQPPIEAQKELVCKLIDEQFLSGSNTGVAKEFEDRFRDYIGCKYVLATSHGHTALASAFFAAGLGPGDEFIVPTYGYLGSYAGALHMGATPVFCEIGPKTLLVDPADIAKRITPRTRCISPIHRCGRVCDMDALLSMAEQNDIVLVDDAAHAHGSEWDGVKIGNLGHIACFSMQGIMPGGKPISAGEGGIVATNDRELYERALIYCHLHRPGAVDELTNPVYKKLDAQLLGWKWRAHPLAIALGLVSLDSLDYRIDHVIASREALREKIAGLPGFEFAHNYPKSKHAELFSGYAYIYDPDALDGLPPAKFVEAVRAEGAPLGGSSARGLEHTRSIFTEDMPGLWGKGHAGPANVPLPRYDPDDFPITRAACPNVMHSPSYIEPADGFIEQFAAAIRKVVEQHKKLL